MSTNLHTFQTEFFANLENAAENSPMQIYETSILGGKIASLRVTYAAVVTLIGDTAFDCIAASYFSVHTESPVDIGQLGIAFPAFLQQHAIMQQLPYIADLARLEWQRHLVSENADAVRTEHYHYRVDLIWQCCQKNYSGDFSIDISPQPLTLMLYRRGQQIVMRTFSDANFV